MQTRPALGGNVMATISTKDSKSQMATARPGVMKKLEPDPSRKGNIIRHNVEIKQADVSLEIIKTEMAGDSVNLGHADVIVSGGKGMRSRDNWQQLLSSIADALSKKLRVSVERGASRAAVEQGFAERIRQVGQTGTSVGPKVICRVGNFRRNSAHDRRCQQPDDNRRQRRPARADFQIVRLLYDWQC